MIDAAFYARGVLEVAPALLGCVVRHGDTSGVIVETEAYHHTEAACHAYVGLTARTSTLYGPPGTAYVYRSYGIHALINAVCEGEDVGAAVLIRAIAPLDGLEIMRDRRRVARDVDIANGPGKLSQALGVDLECNATSLLDGPLRIEPRAPGWEDVAWVTGPRIGITKAVELPWRFCAVGAPTVSRPWPPGLRRSDAGSVAGRGRAA